MAVSTISDNGLSIPYHETDLSRSQFGSRTPLVASRHQYSVPTAFNAATPAVATDPSAWPALQKGSICIVPYHMCGTVILAIRTQKRRQPEIEVPDIVLKPLPLCQFRVVEWAGACVSAEACHHGESSSQAAMAAAA